MGKKRRKVKVLLRPEVENIRVLHNAGIYGREAEQSGKKKRGKKRKGYATSFGWGQHGKGVNRHRRRKKGA